MNPAFLDGLDEARRGLWRSAAESFEAAAEAAPDEPGPVLAAAVCHLEHGDPQAAVVLLETARGVQDLTDEHWRARHAWLQVAARLAMDDAYGAERAAEALPPPLRRRALAHVALRGGDYRFGVAVLLSPLHKEGGSAATAGFVSRVSFCET